MARVELTDTEWKQVVGILATAPWNVANPLLIKISQQLQVLSGDSGEPPSNNEVYPSKSH